MEEIIGNILNPGSIGIILIAATTLYLAYQKNKIDKTAVVGTMLVGFLCLSAGSWRWAIPLVIFFIVGSIETHYNKQKKKKLKVYQTVRTWKNVGANGGAAAIFALLYLCSSNPIFFIGLIAAMATALADTSGTEIGQLCGKPRLIIDLKNKVNEGTAGAVSIGGLGFSLMGSVIISGLLLVWRYPMVIFGICVFSGFLGAMLDSVFGATLEQWQRKFFKYYNTHTNNLVTTLAGGIIAMTLATICL